MRRLGTALLIGWYFAAFLSGGARWTTWGPYDGQVACEAAAAKLKAEMPALIIAAVDGRTCFHDTTDGS